MGLDALRRVGAVTGSFDIRTTNLDWSCERYLRTGHCMPADALAVLQEHDAIYFGAVGHPDVPDHVSLWELLIPIRQGLDLYVNLRPVRVLEGIASPLRNGTPQTVDILCVRENTEGEYTDLGGRLHRGSPDELALQTSLYTRRGIERVVRYAFDRARERKRTLASATKSNALTYTAVLWDEVVRDVAREYPDVTVTSYLIDALAALWAAVLMLEHLGENDGAGLLMRAIEQVARRGPHTADIGGSGTTTEVAAAVVAAIGA